MSRQSRQALSFLWPWLPLPHLLLFPQPLTVFDGELQVKENGARNQTHSYRTARITQAARREEWASRWGGCKRALAQWPHCTWRRASDSIVWAMQIRGVRMHRGEGHMWEDACGGTTGVEGSQPPEMRGKGAHGKAECFFLLSMSASRLEGGMRRTMMASACLFLGRQASAAKEG